MRKEHKNPKGGLTAAGRAYFKRKEGLNLKAPVRRGDNPRRASFLARMGASKGPDYKIVKGKYKYVYLFDKSLQNQLDKMKKPFPSAVARA